MEQDFYRPLITPFELEIALSNEGSLAWDGTYVLDAETILSRAAVGDGTSGGEFGNEEEGDGDGDGDGGEAQFSAMTGRLRTVRRFGEGKGKGKSNGEVLVIPFR